LELWSILRSRSSQLTAQSPWENKILTNTFTLGGGNSKRKPSDPFVNGGYDREDDVP
jgi:hypothetical protein